MKKFILLFVALILSVTTVSAQGFLEGIGQRVKNNIKYKVESKVNNAVDKAVDKALDPDTYTDAAKQDKESKKKGKKGKGGEEEVDAQGAPAADGWKCPECGTAGNKGKFCNECGTKKPEAGPSSWTCSQCGTAGNTGKFCNECGAKADGTKANAKAASEWNKFDFVPGDEVVFYDQLDGEKLGEFPSKWELIDGEAEVQKVNGENVIALMNDGRIMPLIEPMWNYLPDVYTIEFDYYEFYEDEGDEYGRIFFKIMPSTEHNLTWSLLEVHFDNYITKNAHITWKDDSKVITTTAEGNAITTGEGFSNDNKLEKVDFNKWHHISLSVNKRAVKVYFDETRVANIPNYKNPKGGFFGFVYSGGRTEQPAYIKNVRFAKGAVPLYDRMLTDDKFITYGITFDVGKAEIKPESMGELNRIVKLMTENPDLKFEVQGHTDSTGNASSNQKLSEQRAQAIVAKLSEMGIAKDRLTAVGKGQTSPIAGNDTDEGRAKNRRVEFVKK